MVAVALVSGGALAGACGSDNPTEPVIPTGSYAATTFRVTPAGQAQIDVLAAGGSLLLNLGATRTTTGTLTLPASVTGGAPLSASMAGTFTQSGNTIDFVQTADTFVRDLVWTVNGKTLSATNQTAGGATFTIVLTTP